MEEQEPEDGEQPERKSIEKKIASEELLEIGILGLTIILWGNGFGFSVDGTHLTSSS